MSQTSEYRKRIAIVKRWLREAVWTPDDNAFDYGDIRRRAIERWYSRNPGRADQLIAKSARLLLGEAVQIKGGRPPKIDRMEKRTMLKISAEFITPDENTYYLVGPEGLVWAQPAIGEAHIVAARNEQERQTAALYIGELLKMKLVPYGLLLNQLVNVAMFGGSPIRDCQWIKHDEAPAPTGTPDDELPTRPAIIQ